MTNNEIARLVAQGSLTSEDADKQRALNRAAKGADEAQRLADSLKEPSGEPLTTGKRGRPPGAKNKPKGTDPAEKIDARKAAASAKREQKFLEESQAATDCAYADKGKAVTREAAKKTTKKTAEKSDKPEGRPEPLPIGKIADLTQRFSLHETPELDEGPYTQYRGKVSNLEEIQDRPRWRKLLEFLTCNRHTINGMIVYQASLARSLLVGSALIWLATWVMSSTGNAAATGNMTLVTAVFMTCFAAHTGGKGVHKWQARKNSAGPWNPNKEPT